MKTKTPSKQAQVRARVQECATKLGASINEIERDYQPDIVLAAVNRWLNNRREARRISRDQAALRRRQAELRERAKRL